MVAVDQPSVLVGLQPGRALDLPGRKTEYLHAIAEAALDGVLDTATLCAAEPEDAVRAVRQVKGLGPFAAELVVLRGANAPDAVPGHERQLASEVVERYGPARSLAGVSAGWRPYRMWATVHLRVLREGRTRHRSGPDASPEGPPGRPETPTADPRPAQRDGRSRCCSERPARSSSSSPCA